MLCPLPLLWCPPLLCPLLWCPLLPLLWLLVLLLVLRRSYLVLWGELWLCGWGFDEAGVGLVELPADDLRPSVEGFVVEGCETPIPVDASRLPIPADVLGAGEVDPSAGPGFELLSKSDKFCPE